MHLKSVSPGFSSPESIFPLFIVYIRLRIYRAAHSSRFIKRLQNEKTWAGEMLEISRQNGILYAFGEGAEEKVKQRRKAKENGGEAGEQRANSVQHLMLGRGLA